MNQLSWSNINVGDRSCRTKLAIEGMSINMERTKRLEYWEIEKCFIYELWVMGHEHSYELGCKTQ